MKYFEGEWLGIGSRAQRLEISREQVTFELNVGMEKKHAQKKGPTG